MAIDVVSRPAKSAACRCLFGRPSREENAATLAAIDRQHEQYLNDMTAKYDFNFRTSRPLRSGRRYEWTPSGEDVVASPPTAVDRSPAEDRSAAAAAPDSSLDTSSSSDVSENVSPAAARVDESKPTKSRKRQSTMTDHYKHTKRPRGPDAKDGANGSSSSSSSSSSA